MAPLFDQIDELFSLVASDAHVRIGSVNLFSGSFFPQYGLVEIADYDPE
jgi:hypothetical protein